MIQEDVNFMPESFTAATKMHRKFNSNKVARFEGLLEIAKNFKRTNKSAWKTRDKTQIFSIYFRLWALRAI